MKVCYKAPDCRNFKIVESDNFILYIEKQIKNLM